MQTTEMFLAMYNPVMSSSITPWRVLVKGIALFLIAESVLYSFHPDLQRLNVFTGSLRRQRFPISTHAPEDRALDVGSLDAMLASHIVSEPKAPDEFRILVLGDSAVWGVGLTPAQTLPGQLDALGLRCGDKIVRTYNLSFPRSSASKDLMILDKAMTYQPDEIIWLVTWYTLMPKTRNDHPLILQNPDEFYKLAHRFDFLPRDYEQPSILARFTDSSRTVFRVIRYQFYSLIELATGLDQIPGPPEELPAQLSRDASFEGMKPPRLNPTDVSLDQVRDFYQLAGNVPVILVNQPMLVLSNVPNSDIRYNDYYPRWVYDQYRQYLAEAAVKNHWEYLDLWNIFPSKYYTDTPLHLIPEGETELAKIISHNFIHRCH